MKLNKIYKEIKLKINKGNTSSEFVRNYILGIFNLIIGLALLNFFQYYLYKNINFSIRTDLSISSSYLVGVTISYYLTRKYVFQLKDSFGKLIMYLKFLATNSLNYFLPLIVWYFIEYYIPEYSQTFFNGINFLIANVIFPIKFLIYKYLIFKD
tara:strand:- start:8173 stop:8634 length:462 start_codon:yes stop_codon:yes gene_type:complete